MPGLHDLQAAFAAALDGGSGSAPTGWVRARGIDAERRLNVYRHNSRISCAEALGGIYPAVRRVLGGDYFDQIADLFWDAYPSDSGDLRRYGCALAEFLALYPPLAGLPYLPDLARLEWAWHESFHAADAAALGAAALRARFAHGGHAVAELALHPAVRLLRSDYPLAELWAFALDRHTAGDTGFDLSTGTASCVLIARPDLEVRVYEVDPPYWHVFASMVCGSKPEAAIDDARARWPGFDLGGFIDTAAAVGCLTAGAETGGSA